MKAYDKYLYIISSIFFQFFIGIIIGYNRIELEKIFGIYITYIIFAILNAIYQEGFLYFWDTIKKRLKVFIEVEMAISLLSISSNLECWLIGTIINICFLVIEIVILIVEEKYRKKRFLILGKKEEVDRFLKKCVLKTNLFISKYIIDKNKIIAIDEKKELDNLLIKEKIQDIILVSDNKEVIEDIIDYFQKKTKNIYILPNYYESFSWNLKIDYTDRFVIFKYINNKNSKLEVWIKKTLDILCSLIGIFLLIVSYIFWGLKIKKDGGEILFTHKRVGRFLKEFKMYKFRTMKIDAELILKEMLETNEEIKKEYYGNFKLKEDPRVTQIGKFLRETSLDELPQFLNILKGEMSLIGPRPVVNKEIELYYTELVAKEIFEVKPGMTGMWQINGRSDIENYTERIILDRYYVRNWSIWLDIVIIFKTLKQIISRRGAY